MVLNQARALLTAGDDVLIITGELPQPAPELGDIPVVRLDALGYDSAPQAAPQRIEPRELADAIMAAIGSRWEGGADVLHVHNPLIQKNAALIPALRLLAQRGVPLLLQNHDLAEDFRPDVYAGEEEYPHNCHYAVVNSRDYSFLHRAGLKPEGLHLIVNEVSPVQAAPNLERTRYLYPARGVRRKNLGEALLLSLFIPRGRTVAITLPPAGELDMAVYRRWVEFAGELGLPVEFELGLTQSLQDMFGSAVAVLTTSVKEGFGFSYLEPWTAGRTVIGRRIDYVCRDFEDEGLRFKPAGTKADPLYSEIRIPMEYISPPVLKNKIDHTMHRIYQAFGLAVPGYIISMMEEHLQSAKYVDFGVLDEELQGGIIHTLAANPAVVRDVEAINPFLREIRTWQGEAETKLSGLIEANRHIISQSYGAERTGSLLRDTYRTVMTTPVTHKISKALLLELYLDPLKLFLVGVGSGINSSGIYSDG
ncbi:hypothetical protein FACS1894130_03970 [Spirochaetia bacterium]|nr:hypothetical protein FACS1894130_03970 [Spirochaetia bacterium]